MWKDKRVNAALVVATHDLVTALELELGGTADRVMRAIEAGAFPTPGEREELLGLEIAHRHTPAARVYRVLAKWGETRPAELLLDVAHGHQGLADRGREYPHHPISTKDLIWDMCVVPD